LSPANGDHRVDRLDPGLERFIHRLPVHDAGGLPVYEHRRARLDGPLAVSRLAQWTYDATQELRPGWHLKHASSAPNRIAFFELQIVAEHDSADVIFFEIKGESGNQFTGLRRLDLEHLVRYCGGQAPDAGNAVLHLENFTDLFELQIFFEVFDLIEERLLHFAGAKRCV